MRSPELLRARYATAFSRACDSAGLPPAKHLAKANIHESLLSNGERWMPISQLSNFVTSWVRQSGYRELGLVASRFPRQQHSDFSRKVLFSPTLHQSLGSICRNAHLEDTSAHFQLIRRGETLWLESSATKGTQEWVQQLELFRFGGLLEIIRFAAGSDWLPPVVQLQSLDDGQLQESELIRDINIRFGSPNFAIPIPTNLLIWSLQEVPADDESKTGANFEVDGSSPADYDEAVRVVIRNQLGCSALGIAAIAECMGVSTRSLQRYLATHGTSFSELLEQTRILVAREMLTETTMSHRDIARELGYRYDTHFSRAFRRVCGVTPRQYRSYVSGA